MGTLGYYIAPTDSDTSNGRREGWRVSGASLHTIGGTGAWRGGSIEWLRWDWIAVSRGRSDCGKYIVSRWEVATARVFGPLLIGRRYMGLIGWRETACLVQA